MSAHGEAYHVHYCLECRRTLTHPGSVLHCVQPAVMAICKEHEAILR